MTAQVPDLTGLHPDRMRTYRAEDRARLAVPADPLGGTQKDAQAYVDRITRSAWWRRTCQPSWLGNQNGWGSTESIPTRIIVKAGRGRNAHASSGRVMYRGRYFPTITLGSVPYPDLQSGWTCALTDPYVILHEIAHIMAMCDPREEAGHGWLFRRYYLALVRRWLGPEHAAALRAGYKAEKLKWREPKAARKTV